MNMSVVRNRLFHALTLKNRENVDKSFAWGLQLDSCPKTIFSIESFYVDQINKDIPVPVSLKNVDILASIVGHGNQNRASFYFMSHEDPVTLQINQKRIRFLSPDSSSQSLPSHLINLVLMNLMRINPDSVSTKNLEAHFGKLLIVKKGQQGVFCSNKEILPGTFAFITIIIPVEGGHLGGRIDIHSGSEKKSFCFENQSDCRLSFLAYYSDCHQVMEPVTNGCMMAMVFHLRWNDNLKYVGVPISFPCFINTLEEVNSHLISWEDAHQSTVGTSDCISSGEDLLIFPLEEKYNREDLSLPSLYGRDRLLATIFQSIPYLDVHLALVSQLIDNNLDPHIEWDACTDWNQRTFHLDEWICASNSLPLSGQLSLTLENQLVGNIQRIQSVANGPNPELNQVVYYHAVLVIQPRRQSILNACRCSLDSVLSHMEHQLAKLLIQPDSRPVVRQQLISTLGQVISFCQYNPSSVWMDPSPAADERSRRLLKLCLQLRAEDHGLDLLNSMGTLVALNADTTASRIPDMFLEGVRNGKVAKAVADFVSQVEDWESCAVSLTELISAFKIFRQLPFYSELALCLLENNCIKGAQIVGDRLAVILAKLTGPQTNFLKDQHFESFIHMVLVLDSNVFTIDPSRINSVSIVFNRLEIQRKIRLLTVYLQSNFDLQKINLKSITTLIRLLCSRLAANDLMSVTTNESIIGLLKVFARLRDDELVEPFINPLCLDDSKSIDGQPALLSILSSPNLLELADTSGFGKTLVKQMLDVGIDMLTGLMKSAPTDVADEPVRSVLATCFNLVMKMADNSSSSEPPSSMVSIGFVLFNLPAVRLCQLIVDVHHVARVNLQSRPPSFKLYVDLCRLICSRNKEFINKLDQELVLQLFQCFIMTEDLELGRWLVHQITLNSGTASWDATKRNNLFDIILSTPDLLDNLIPASSTFVAATVDAIMEAWTTKMIRQMDEKQTEEKRTDLSTDDLDEDLAWCVELFLRNERDWPHTIEYGVDLFSPLIDKLSVWQLGQLLAGIYQRESDEEFSSLLEHTTCLHLCCFIGRQLVARDLSYLLKSTNDSVVAILLDAMLCLLWLKDESSVLLAQQICHSCHAWEENVIVQKTVASPEARIMAGNSESNRKAFGLLLDQRIQRLKRKKFRESLVPPSNADWPGLASETLVELEAIRSLQRNLQEQITNLH